ncbi:putative germin-like protein 2-1 [Typha angustifolia]|uniref:putative germin-like protein 2-1 n=1 Tax=Typha angustifolia TaxID=59011 RepID=UPI003C2D5EFA
MAASIIGILVLLALTSPLALASDPSPLQDFCVADEMPQVFVNGFVCKDPKLAKAEDFFYSGLDKPGDTNNKDGSKVTLVDVQKLPGLNTLGIAVARLDVAPFGINPPHTHPRATEILTVLEGSFYAGFITSDNKLFAKVISKGDVFVFPKGLIHFEFNYGTVPAVGIASLSSQNPGLIRVADALFGSNPRISEDVLAKAFQVDKKIIDWLKTKF